jgi:uncharacterized membrane protein
MKQLLQPGRIIYATGIFVLGILSIVFKDFIVGRPPAWPPAFTMPVVIGYISGTLLMIAALAIIFKKKALLAALLVALMILLLSLSRHIPQFMKDWANAYKTMALMGGSLVIAASFLKVGDDANKNTGKLLVLFGTLSITAFFIVGGYAHFKYAAFVDTLIPGYIPFHRACTYFCGACLLAGGAGLLIRPVRKWAALLSAIMVTGWLVLLHIPRFIADINNVSDRLGLCESFTVAGILFVLAAIFKEREAPSR